MFEKCERHRAAARSVEATEPAPFVEGPASDREFIKRADQPGPHFSTRVSPEAQRATSAVQAATCVSDVEQALVPQVQSPLSLAQHIEPEQDVAGGSATPTSVQRQDKPLSSQ